MSALNGLRGLLSVHILVGFEICEIRDYNMDLFQVYHYIWAWTLGKVKINGSLEISTFLILSGYGLTLTYGSEKEEKKLKSAWRFYLKRIARYFLSPFFHLSFIIIFSSGCTLVFYSQIFLPGWENTTYSLPFFQTMENIM